MDGASGERTLRDQRPAARVEVIENAEFHARYGTAR
jgi:hypothetical protein